MKKTHTLIVTLFLLFFAGEALAQKNFGIGAAYGGCNGKMEDQIDSFGVPRNQNRTLAYLGLVVAYRTNTLAIGKGGIGLNIPVTIGVGNSKIYYDAAVIAHLQMGALSSTENYEKRGYYLGAGIGIAHATWNPIVDGTNAVSILTVNSFTPVFELGWRQRVGRAEKYTDACFFYKLNSNPDPKHNIYGFKILYYLK